LGSFTVLGKSALLRIMGGALIQNITVKHVQLGRLLKSATWNKNTSLDPTKNVRGIVEEAFEEVITAMARLDAV